MALSPEEKKNVEETKVLIQDTLISVGAIISNTLRDAVADMAEDVDATVATKLSKDFTRTFTSLAKATDLTANNTFRLKQGLLSSKDISKQLLALEERKLSLDRLKQRAQLQGLDVNEKAFAEALQAAQQAIEADKELLEIEKKITDEIESRIGLTGKLAGALSKIPGLGSLLNAKEIEEGLRSYVAGFIEVDEQGNQVLKNVSKTAVMFKGMSMAVKQVGKGLVDPLTILTTIVDAFLDLNKASVEFQRLTGQNESVQAGLNLRVATSVDYLKTATELTEKLGLNANNVFRSETIAAAAEFKNLLGLSGDQAGNLALLAEATGTSLDTSTEQLVDQVSAFNKSNRSAVSQGKVLKDVANTSEAITVSLGANPAKLAAAASQAARLGMQLKDVDAIANSLLDFESSIEAELEAQLLTGREINLAKAREYALTNQLDKLGQEIFENTADIAEYGQMNRIAQEAYAKSLGMTRDQLARTAYLRALEAGMTEDQAKAAANVSLEDMKRISAQESLNKSIEKMAQALAGPAELLASMLGSTVGMYTTMGLIVTLVGANLISSLGSAVRLMKSLSVLSRITAIAKGWTAAFSGPQALLTGGLAGLATGAAITAAIMSSTEKGDDIMSPGYGQRTLFGPEGAIALNNKDTVIAGTNLFPETQQVPLVSNPTLSLEPLAAEIRAMKDELKGILTAIRDKEGSVYLDTDLVGKALVVGSTAI